MAAEENHILFLRQLLRHALMEGGSLGRYIDGPGFFPDFLRHRSPGPVHRLSLHDHARAAAVGVIVHFIVLIVCKVTNIDGIQTNRSIFDGPACDAGL